MDFLSDDHKKQRARVRAFAQEVIAPRVPALDAAESFDVELTRQMGEMGFFGMTVPAQYGGHAKDFMSYIITAEELARVDASQAATVVASNSLGIAPILEYGSENQKEHYLPPLCQGAKLWSFALTEPDAGSDAGATRTAAENQNGHWLINGQKTFITNASTPISWGASVLCVTGVRENGKKQLSCFLVENDTPGYSQKPIMNKMCWRASNTSELVFESVKVPNSAMLGPQGAGFRMMLKTLDAGRLSISAMALGGAQGAFEAAHKHARARKQFGKLISNFQANAFKLADMETEITAARELLYLACRQYAAGRNITKLAAMAKLYTSEVFARAADHCLQIHGGIGLLEDRGPAARFFRDRKLLEIGEGTSEIMRIVIARLQGCFDKEI